MEANDKYQNRDINDEIEKKINTFDTTRENRLEMSKRLANYDSKWKVVFFCLNIEAVIFILLALSELRVSLFFSESAFYLLSGIFSIYVILLQYYINSLNYRERALKLHYHQLDLEDLILKLKSIFLKENDPKHSVAELDAIKEYQTTMFEYQSLLKNNENHSPLDYKVNKFYRAIKVREKEKNIENTNENNKDTKTLGVRKMFKNLKPMDFTVDNLILNLNILFAFGLLLVLANLLLLLS